MQAVDHMNTCFVISPIGAENSPDRKHADQLLKHIILPNTDALNIYVERADQITETGSITSQIVERLIASDVVIADLSKRNPNVYYELAIRHLTKKPCIHLISDSDDLPFDVNTLRAIPFSLTDPDSISAARDALKRYLEKVPKIAKPIFGEELDKQFTTQVLSEGMEAYFRFSLKLPDELLEDARFVPLVTSGIQTLSPDVRNLPLLRQHFRMLLQWVDFLEEKNKP